MDINTSLGDHSGLCSQEAAPQPQSLLDDSPNYDRGILQMLFTKLEQMESKSEERARLQDARIDQLSMELAASKTRDDDDDAISTIVTNDEFGVDQEVTIPDDTAPAPTKRPAGDRMSVLGQLLPNSAGVVTPSQGNPGTISGPETNPTAGKAAEESSATDAQVASQPPHTKLDLVTTIVQQYDEEKKPAPKEPLGPKLHPDLEKHIKVCWMDDSKEDTIIEGIHPKFPTPEGLEGTIRSQALNPVFSAKNKQGHDRLHWYYSRNQKRLQDIQDVGTKVTNIFASIADHISASDRDNVVISSQTVLKAALSGITLMGRINRLLVERRKWCVYSGCKTDQVEKLCSKDLLTHDLLFGDNIKDLIVEAKEDNDLANSLFSGQKQDHGTKRKSERDDGDKPSYSGYYKASKNSQGQHQKDRDKKNNNSNSSSSSYPSKTKKKNSQSSSTQGPKKHGGRQKK